MLKKSFKLLCALSFVGLILGAGAKADISPQSQYLLDVQRAFPSEDYILIDTNDVQLAVIQHSADTSSIKGVATLLSDMSQTPDKNLLGLSRKLNAVGWITLLVAAPPTQILDSFTATDLTADNQQNIVQLINSGAFVNQQAFADVEQRLQQQMTSVAEQAKKHPGFQLIVARGTTAAWLTKLYSQKNLPPPDGLVVLGPYWPQATLNNYIADYIATSGTAVLDIYSTYDNNWVNSTVRQRRIAANKAFKVHYRQREIVGLPSQSTQQNTYISNEIIGWIKSMGW
ncbi:DUF3530 family protein [Neptunicella sp. SCSIO 80796]|uniref:DUF3530 family protein n=1 Tax=Neptunicella plasticusilytica TaxID=3117012 RepID=UPI003A4DB0BD